MTLTRDWKRWGSGPRGGLRGELNSQNRPHAPWRSLRRQGGLSRRSKGGVVVSERLRGRDRIWDVSRGWRLTTESGRHTDSGLVPWARRWVCREVWGRSLVLGMLCLSVKGFEQRHTLPNIWENLTGCYAQDSLHRAWAKRGKQEGSCWSNPRRHKGGGCEWWSDSRYYQKKTETSLVVQWLRLHGSQPRCPSADKWIRTLWYTYTMQYYSAIKKNALKSVLIRRMKLEPIIQSEVSQNEKHRYSNINTYIWNLERW